MSFDIFLMTLVEDESGERLQFDRSIVEKAFGSIAADPENDDWQFTQPDGFRLGAEMYIDPGPEISGFSVGRPPAMLEFWDALYEVMRQTPTVRPIS